MGRLTWLPDVLRAHDLDVVTMAGWETRGRATIAPRVIVNHHTAARQGYDAPSLQVCMLGRPGVGPPLANVLIARSGRCYIIASGTANNAGEGGWQPHGASTNAHTIGIEVENDGVGEPWSAGTYDTLVAVNAAICRHLWWPADRCIAHKEWAPKRKVDPTFDMAAFRHHVAQRLIAPNQEDAELTPDESRMLHELWWALVTPNTEWRAPDGMPHNVSWPILATNSRMADVLGKLDLLLAANNKGVDPVAIANAVVAELGEDMARDLMSAMGRVLSEASTKEGN